MKQSEFEVHHTDTDFFMNVLTTHHSLQNGTKKRKVDDESVNFIPDSGISCGSSQIFADTQYQQPKVSIEVSHSPSTLL